MVKAVYINSVKRWLYNSFNMKLKPNDDSVPLMDERMIISLNTVLNNYKLIEEDSYYHSRSRAARPFLVTHEKFLYPGSLGAVIIENDPVNTIEAALDTSIHGNPEIEAERMIGNYREGLNRKIIHLGDSPTIVDYADLTNALQTGFPFFPPLPSDFTKPDRVLIESSDGGFKRYIKSKNPAVSGDPSALEAIELTGQKIIIWDPTNAKFITQMLKADYAISADDSKNVKLTDIETVLNGASGKGGLADIHANLGTFLPSEKSWTIINIAGQSIIETTDTKVSIRMYDATFATLQTEFEMLQSGNLVITAGTTVVTLTKSGTFDVS